MKRFLLTRLLRGVTLLAFCRQAVGDISTHTPSAASMYENGQFLLTRLLRGVTAQQGNKTKKQKISTHTPLARRDLARFLPSVRIQNFYSHASCEA